MLDIYTHLSLKEYAESQLILDSIQTVNSSQYQDAWLASAILSLQAEIFEAQGRLEDALQACRARTFEYTNIASDYLVNKLVVVKLLATLERPLEALSEIEVGLDDLDEFSGPPALNLLLAYVHIAQAHGRAVPTKFGVVLRKIMNDIGITTNFGNLDSVDVVAEAILCASAEWENAGKRYVDLQKKLGSLIESERTAEKVSQIANDYINREPVKLYRQLAIRGLIREEEAQ